MSARPPLRVLVLEGHAAEAEQMVGSLSASGYEVTWTRAADQESFAAQLRPDLDVVLADSCPPAFDVQRALAQLADTGLSVPLIVVSGSLSEQEAVDCIKSGAADYLTKDRLTRLPTAVASALAARRLRDEREAAVMALEQTAEELATANEALRAADTLKDQMLAITAHELRTPLTSILGYTTLLHREWDGRARELGQGWVGIVQDQARRMLAHVEDLLTLTAAELGAVQLQLEAIPLAPALSSAVAAAVPGGVDLRCPDDLVVLADRLRFGQIITNLLVNAVKHGGGRIEVEARASAESGPRHWVEVRVRDDGPGVAPEFVPLLFDKFAQATSRTRGAGGFGLGLAIAASLAAAHDGSVWYEPGEPGACFALRMPAATPDAATPDADGRDADGPDAR